MAGIITIGVIPTKYDIIVPAGVENLNNTFSFDGYSTKDVNVYSVSVYEYYNISVLSYVMGKINPYSIISEHNNYVITSDTYVKSSGSIQKTVSLINSLIAGYNSAGKVLNHQYLGAVIHTLLGEATNYFEVADIVTKVEGNAISPEKSINYWLYQTYGSYELNGSNYINIQLNTPYHFTVLRKGVEVEVTAYAFNYQSGDITLPILGISYYNYYSVDKTTAEVSYNLEAPTTIGPSAGLMQALFIYDSLADEHLTKGIKIVGTGTIDEFGKAGAIGGVEAKLVSAYLAHADIFFVPVANYEEALARYQKFNNPKMKLVSVTSLDDVINYLRNYKVGA